MATLATDTPRIFEETGEIAVNELDVIASDTIYAGAAVGESASTGTYRPLVSGDNFAGFATEKAANETGAASAIRCKVRQKGSVKLSVTGVSATAQVGATVFATDDNVFTLTPGGTKIGIVKRWVTGALCIVDFDATLSNTERFTFSYPIDLHASKTVYNLHTASFPMRVTAINWVTDIAQAITGTVVKATGTNTPASATTPMHTAAAVVINTTAHTVLPITLTSTAADLALAAGDRIGFVLSAALTSGSGVVSIEYERIRA